MTNSTTSTVLSLPPLNLQVWCSELPWGKTYSPMPARHLKSDTAWVVLSVPHGRKHSKEVRQWVKSIGGHFNSTHKQWRILPHRCTADAIAVINSLCLFHSVVSKAQAFPPSYTSRLAPSGGVVYLNIPFEERGVAKADGAKWDGTLKRWYFRIIHNDPKFAALVAKYESQGWVNAGETEANNIGLFKAQGWSHGGSIADNLISHRPADASEATQEFKSMPWVGKNSPCEMSTHEEREFLAGILVAYQKGVPENGENVMMQYVLHTPLTDDAAIAIGKAPRVVFRRLIGKAEKPFVSVCSYGGGKRIDTQYLSADDARTMWNSFVQDGYTNAGGCGFNLIQSARITVWDDPSAKATLYSTMGVITDRRTNGNTIPPFPHLPN